MSQDSSYLLTKKGLKRLQAEMENLVEVEMPDILAKLAEARAHGDLSENSEYHAAKERKAMIAARVQEVNDILMRAEVFEPNAEQGKGRCIFGTFVRVRVEDIEKGIIERDFQLVNSIEADMATGKLSMASPLGSALLGKEVGDIVDINVQAGTLEYEIIEISYPS